MKKASRFITLDTLHRTFVWGCFGFTSMGTLFLFSHIVGFFAVTKPAHEAEQKKELLELLKEGREKEEELKDAAPTSAL